MSEFNDFLKTQNDIHAVNAIAAFLSLTVMPKLGTKPVDLVIHAGNAILETAHACLQSSTGRKLFLGFFGRDWALDHDSSGERHSRKPAARRKPGEPIRS